MTNKRSVLAALLALIVLLGLGFAGCATEPVQVTPAAPKPAPEAAPPKPPEPFTLKLVETTDVHGAIFPYDFIEDRPAATSLAQVYSYVRAERARPGAALSAAGSRPACMRLLSQRVRQSTRPAAPCSV